MTRDAALSLLQKIVRETLDNPHVVLTDATTADDVPYWDSLAHVRIMVRIEEHFAIRFEPEELTAFPNVGALVDSIVSKVETA